MNRDSIDKLVKATERSTHILHILFENGEKRTYHIFPDNIALKTKFLLRKGSGISYLMSKNLTWTFRHMKGIACIKTGTVISINIEKLDHLINPLSMEDNYDDPLN